MPWTAFKPPRKALQLVEALAWLLVLLGALVMGGWLFELPRLTQLSPHWVSMKFNTALLFLACGLSLWLTSRRQRQASSAVASAMLCLALLTALEHLTGWDLRIDQWAVNDPATVKTSAPGRMAPNTAICFLLLSVALIAANNVKPLRLRQNLVSALGGCVTGFAAVAVGGYFLGIDAAYGWGQATAMALHTALGLAAAGSALIALAWAPQQTRTLGNKHVSALLLPLGMLLSVFNILLWIAQLDFDQQETRIRLNNQADTLRRELEHNLSFLGDALWRMKARHDSNPPTEAAWREDALQYLHTFPALRQLAIVSPTQQIHWQASLQTSSAATPKHWPPAPNQTLTASAPYALHATPDAQQLTLFFGLANQQWLAAEVDLHQLVAPSVMRFKQHSLWLVIRQDQQTLFRFASHPDGQAASWSNSLPVIAAGLNWRLRIGSLPSPREQQSNRLAHAVFIAGWLITALILSMVHWLQRNQLLEQQLHKEQQTRLTLMLEAIPSPMLLIDHAGLVVQVNQPCLTSLGFTRQELLASPLKNLFPGRFHQPYEALLAQAKQASGTLPPTRLMQVHNRLGEEMAVEISLVPLLYQNSQQLLVSFVNLSEREQFIAELARSNQELNNFAYVASHDLRSPLRGIDQLASWLNEDYHSQLDERGQDYLRLIRQRIQRMEHLLDDLLAYARIGRLFEPPETFACEALVRNTFDMLNNNQAFTLQLLTPLPVLHGQRPPFELVMRNLLSNAIKHHDRGTGSITISAEQHDCFWQFKVCDDGPGIAPEHHVRIFTMLQTLRSRDEVEGSGMGLAIVKKTVEFFRGHVSVSANQPRGTCFTFTWPIKNSGKPLNCAALPQSIITTDIWPSALPTAQPAPPKPE